MSVVLEDPRQRIAVGGVTATGGDQRAGRVCGDELGQEPLGGIRATRSVPIAGRQDRGERTTLPRVGHEQVHEARPGDLPPLQVLTERRLELAADPLGDLSRRRAQHGRQQHRRVGRVVALLLALGAFDPQLHGRLAVSAADRRRGLAHGRGQIVKRRTGGIRGAQIGHPDSVTIQPAPEHRSSRTLSSGRARARGSCGAIELLEQHHARRAGGAASSAPATGDGRRVSDRWGSRTARRSEAQIAAAAALRFEKRLNAIESSCSPSWCRSDTNALSGTLRATLLVARRTSICSRPRVPGQQLR